MTDPVERIRRWAEGRVVSEDDCGEAFPFDALEVVARAHRAELARDASRVDAASAGQRDASSSTDPRDASHLEEAAIAAGGELGRTIRLVARAHAASLARSGR